MKLMAIIGSPRKGGNTELLINQVIAGCRSKTAVDLETLFVVEKKIEYCTGCMSCVLMCPDAAIEVTAEPPEPGKVKS